MGRYCGMNVLEHPGPKGQIILEPTNEAVWFSSARDTLAFTMLPEEPKGIAAIYVSDMAKAPSWEEPGAENWVDARKAFFVIESAAVGGMGHRRPYRFRHEKQRRSSLRKRAAVLALLPKYRRITFSAVSRCGPPILEPKAMRIEGGQRISRRLVLAGGAAGVVFWAIPKHAVSLDLPEPIIWRSQAMGAPAKIILYHPDRSTAERLLREAAQEAKRLENIFSLYREDSELAQLNRDGALASPSPDLVEVLRICHECWQASDGLFDPTVQPLWNCLKSISRKNILLPTDHRDSFGMKRWRR